MHRVIAKFTHAIEGILHAIKTDMGVVIQVFFAVITLSISFFLNLTLIEWIIILLCIMLVLGAELFNTAIENICDLLQDKEDQKIKAIKDISAGAVLMFALGALIVMSLILLNKGGFLG